MVEREIEKVSTFQNLSEQKLLQKAVGYARFSTQKQDGGVTIESQDREMRSLAKSKGWEYLRTYVDEAVSGAVPVDDRAGLSELFDNESEYDIVICLDASRLARDQRIFWNAVGRLRDMKKVLVTCVMPEITSDKPEFEVIAGSIQGMAAYERRMIGIKTHLAHEVLKEHGKAQGRPRFGFMINESGYFEPRGVGVKALEMLKENPNLKPKTLGQALDLEYYDAWTLLNNCKKYEEELSKRI